MIATYLTFIVLNVACVFLMFEKDAERYGRTILDQITYEYVGSTFVLKICVAGILFVPLAGVYAYFKYMSED